MARWNDTIRDLSKEFHDFQKASGTRRLGGRGTRKTRSYDEIGCVEEKWCKKCIEEFDILQGYEEL